MSLNSASSRAGEGLGTGIVGSYYFYIIMEDLEFF
jgi:hypothetical protein